jgi:signal transduction histidine kinase/DNA-binding response OmpR family regulator
MSRFTYLKIILLITGAALLLGSAFYFFSKNNELLLSKVDEVTRPDALMNDLKLLHRQLSIAENHVRAFTLSQTEDYIRQYNQIKERILEKTAVITHTASGQVKFQTDSLTYIVHQQLKNYDELLRISYSKILDSALTDIREISVTDSSELEDSASVANLSLLLLNSEKKKSFFSDLFSNKKKQRELQELIKKAQQDMNKKQQAIQRAAATKKQMAEAAEKQRLQIQELNEREFKLLEEEKLWRTTFETIMTSIEENRQKQNEKNIEEARQAVSYTSQMMKWLMIGGSAVILILTLLLVIDIIKSERRREELFMAKKKAEQLAAARQQFLSMMSHEIRTPLTGISGYTALLSKSVTDRQQAKYLNNIAVSADHLLKLVDDILELSRLDAGRLSLEKTVFSPARITEEVCDLLRVKANQKNIILSCYIKEIDGLYTLGDPHKLTQILYNLTGNAVKFTAKGSVTVECKKEKTDETRTMLKFIIRDTGIGIPDDKIHFLFKDFAQADITIPKRFGGSGLGLSITQKLVALHGGTIRVKSIEGMGSEFTVVLPYAVAQPPAEILEPPSELKEKTLRLNGIKVLITDDTDINLMLQKEMLQHLGAETATASNGTEAVQLIKHNPGDFDVALIDLNMPDMNGEETLRIIRQELKSAIPVVATTANPVTTDRLKLLNTGFNEVLIKPFEQLTLARTLLALIPEKIKEPQPEVRLYDVRELELTSRGSTDFVHRMMKVFLFSAESLIKKLKSAVAENDFELLAASAHKLLPSCRQLSIHYMADRLKWIEEHSEEHFKMELRQKIEEVSRHFEDVKSSMEEQFAKTA